MGDSTGDWATSVMSYVRTQYRDPERLPTFLIVGTMKSGTSTLAGYLDRIPGVRVPRRELHFFNRDANYERGLDWYASHFADVAAGTICGEKTPTYSYAEHVPPRIHHYDPSVSMIWILRDPVDRAYSHYWYGVARGRQSATFEEAIRAELAGRPTHPWQRYIHRGRYADQIERFLDTGFSLDQMLFLDFADLVKRPAEVVGRTASFIGAAFEGEKVKRVWRNRSKPGGSGGYEPMTPEIRALIASELEDSNKRLLELTGIDFTAR